MSTVSLHRGSDTAAPTTPPLSLGLKLLRIGSDIADEIVPASPEARFETIATILQADGGREALRACAVHESEYLGSWLYSKSAGHHYLIFDFLEHEENQAKYGARHLYFDILTSHNPLIPYDYRAIAANLWLSAARTQAPSDAELHQLAAAANCDLAPRRRSWLDKISVVTDGIDHLFVAHYELPDLLKLMSDVAGEEAAWHSNAMLTRVAARFGVAAERPHPYASADDAFYNDDVGTLIAEDVGAQLIEPLDYMAFWDRVYEVDAGATTLAELLRIILLRPEFSLPDQQIRPALLAFLRAALKLSGRAIIGLGAGAFHVEHGSRANPSLFYMARGAILGKGCKIDTVGGTVLLQESFLGGGFVPLLIHTHKHLNNKSAGADERKSILPCIFVARRRARLPMHVAGMIETADFLSEPCPHAGIEAYPV
ncbi:hypothetical protein [Paraburkholderia phenazinium]|uniref:hypothetical protein n=1 Tax=Paraburkholderia phenazinium TaxID=60549 RepID=UPI00158E78DF|nr:hypothetical protein [Paraburkholderia phenazinium]